MSESRTSLFVSGICCTSEETIVRKRLDAVVGHGRYSFNAATAELFIDKNVDAAIVAKELRAAGFGVRRRQEAHVHEPFIRRHQEGIVTLAAGLLAAAGIFLEFDAGSNAISRALLLSAILLGGWKPAIKAVAAARTLTPDMNLLMSIAVVGALLIDKWSEGAAVIVLYSFSLALESYSTYRTRKAIRSLMALSPEQATVRDTAGERIVNARSVRIGERIFIRPGDRVPLDGIVFDGASSVNQAPITGESNPSFKKRGDTVYAGSINGRGALSVEVTKVYEETVLSQIVHLVENAQQQKAPVAHLVDRFARIYTPVVLGIALVVAVFPPLVLGASFYDWFYRALVLLVIACPCALVISTPVTIVSALTNAARHGILVKGGKHLETLGTTRAVAFDKTGTLTSGALQITDIVTLNSLTENRVLEIAASLEQQSEHHIARAVVTAARRRFVDFESLEVGDFEAIPGRGVRGTISGTTYYLGSHEFCHGQNACSADVETLMETFSRRGMSCVILGKSTGPLAVLVVSDTARDVSRSVVTDLRAAGVEHVVMTTGDHDRTAEGVAALVGIEHVHAGMLPGEKVRVVEDLRERYGSVVMVGDGVNDAPALAAATTGIAMGVSGSDAAMETADVILMGDDLSRLPFLIRLSRASMSIIKQNIALALVLKLVFLVLSIAGVATLWMAVLADDGATLLVILNGLRVLYFSGKT